VGGGSTFIGCADLAIWGCPGLASLGAGSVAWGCIGETTLMRLDLWGYTRLHCRPFIGRAALRGWGCTELHYKGGIGRASHSGIAVAYSQASIHPYQWHHCFRYIHKLHLLQNEHHDMPHQHILYQTTS
jgi:hypothetical protein